MGLSHILLPERSLCVGDNNVKKFADTAICQMVSEMQAHGASIYRMKAKIAGGAQMFINSSIKIGERNVITVKRELCRMGINITGCDVGENYGRTMECHAANGKVMIKTIGRVHSI
jgi:chemotaxis protein CheD